MTTQTLRKISLISYLSLVTWVILWQFLLTNVESYSLLFRLLWVLPLLAPFHGIIKGKPYTHAWANFVFMLYLMHGLTMMYASDGEALYAVIEVILSFVAIVSCSLFARKRGQELGIGLKKLKDVMAEEKERFEGK